MDDHMLTMAKMRGAELMREAGQAGRYGSPRRANTADGARGGARAGDPAGPVAGRGGRPDVGDGSGTVILR